MPGYELLLPFLLATLVFAYMPGPALLYSAARTLAGGRRRGLLAALGIHLGGYLHVICAGLGLAAVLELVPLAFTAIKLVGAAYLLWLAWRMVRVEEGGSVPALAAKSGRRAFAESVTVEVLNPKTALFFLAFLPQFVDPAAALPIWAQLLVLGVAVNLLFSSADLVTVFLAASLAARLRRSDRAQKLLRWFGGSVLAGLSLHLATERS